MSVASTIRRWVAGICLFVSLTMLVLGSTILDNRLKSYHYLIYWSVCICLTMASAFWAMLDLFLLRRRFRREQSLLIEQTLRDAQTATGKIQGKPMP